MVKFILNFIFHAVRDVNGKFVVKLLFIRKQYILDGKTYEMALRRFQGTENRFKENTYIESLKQVNKKSYYMPHHAVSKKSWFQILVAFLLTVIYFYTPMHSTLTQFL